MEYNIDEIEKYLKEILGYFKIYSFTVNLDSFNKDVLYVNLEGENLNFLVKSSGEVINSLQYILTLNINNIFGCFLRIVLDYNNFRHEREKYLEFISNKFSSEVIKKGRAITLEPMNPFERRIVHSYISNISGVYSKSIGNELNRCVVIYPGEQSS